MSNRPTKPSRSRVSKTKTEATASATPKTGKASVEPAPIADSPAVTHAEVKAATCEPATVGTIEEGSSLASTMIAEPQSHPWLTHRLVFSDRHSPLEDIESEWLLTNGCGSFSMGSAPGLATRRYHGLLIAAANPPVNRISALGQVLDQLILTHPTGADQLIEFTSLLFRDGQGRPVTNPSGVGLLRSFQKGLFAQWNYSWGNICFTRELYLHWQEQAITLRYLISGLDRLPGNAKLRLLPMLTLRDFHGLARQSNTPPCRTDAKADRVSIRRADLSMTLTCGQSISDHKQKPAMWTPIRDNWWYSIYYPADAERGQECLEDYFVPGAFEIPLQPAADGQPICVMLSAALGDRPADPQGWTIDDRATRLEPVSRVLEVKNPSLASPQVTAILRDPSLNKILAIAADDFVVERTNAGKQYPTIMAGYPWFADWGRDTFIALPGLLLTTQRFAEARQCLRLYATYIKDGLIPNRFDDYQDSAAHYNTVDASLWFIRAALEYVQTSDDLDSWHDWLSPVCLSIMDAYIKGTQYGIRVGGDGLVTAGNWQTQLTWMDAACGGHVFTPRPGKAVEINALWYYALMKIAELMKEVPGSGERISEHYSKLADRIRRSFLKTFWNEERQMLRDWVYIDEQGNEHMDSAIRCNQIFAASLPISPIPRTKQIQVVQAVRNHLLTPAGLRTLAADDPNYHPYYSGPQFDRDRAYHQGTIWPWLMGPMVEAILRTQDFSLDARRDAINIICPLLEQILSKGLGQLNEIHEAQPDHTGRHRPVGCPAQAWSVGELIRVLSMIDQPNL